MSFRRCHNFFNTVTDLGMSKFFSTFFCFLKLPANKERIKRTRVITSLVPEKFPVATLLFISPVSISQVYNLDDGGICILVRVIIFAKEVLF